MVNLRNKTYEKMNNHWKVFLWMAMVSFVINASYAFGTDVLLVVGKKDVAGQNLLLKGGPCLMPRLTGRFQNHQLL